jgi:hypothetical protein
MVIDDIGSCNAILRGIRTLVDGSISVSFEINPEDQQIISKLLNKYSLNKKLFTLGIVAVDEVSKLDALDDR